MIVIRRSIAILLGVLFLFVFMATVTSCFAVATAADEKFVPDLLDQADAYNFVYDEVLDALLDDVVTGQYDLPTTGGGPTVKLAFEDPARAKAALRAFVETVVPLEYVRQEVTQVLAEVQPFVTGRTDEFVVDLETGERILRIPDALRAASAELNLGELIADQVIGVIVRDRVGELLSGPLGIALTPEEAVATANRVMPPEWIEQRIFETADAVAPYLAGRSDTFEVRIELKDRVKAVGEVFKDKLVKEDTATKMIFDQVANPMVNTALGGFKVLSFDITITPEDVDAALRQVAPTEWVRQQGNQVIDASVAYLTSETDRLQYSVDLKDRKAAAVVALRDLTKRKLTQIADQLPGCTGAQDNVLAVADLQALKVPGCRPLNLSGEAIVTGLLPLVLSDLNRLVTANIPDQVTYTDAEFRAALGADAIKTLEDVRDLLQKGIVFTQQDILANIKDPQDRADVEDVIAKVRAGAKWDQNDILDLLGPNDRQSFEDVRHWAALVIEFRWVLILGAALVLIVIGVLGGRSWSGRLLWASMTLTVVALTFFIVIQVVGGFGVSLVRDELDKRDLPAEMGGQQFRSDFPATASLLDSPKMADKAADVARAVSDKYRNAILPWLVAGAIGTALGIGWRVMRGTGKTRGAGGSGAPLNVPSPGPGLPAR